MIKRIDKKELAGIEDHFLLERFAEKAIHYSKSGDYQDYQESIDYAFEIKRRLELVREETEAHEMTKQFHDNLLARHQEIKDEMSNEIVQLEEVIEKIEWTSRVATLTSLDGANNFKKHINELAKREK